MKVLFALMLLALSTQTFAKNAIQELLEQKSDTNAYTILKDYYHYTKNAAEYDDLNLYDLDSGIIVNRYNKCVIVHSQSPQNIYPVDLILVKKDKVIPAVPSNGPLFPGIPEQRIPRAALYHDPQEIKYQYDLERRLDSTSIAFEFDSLFADWKNVAGENEYEFIKKNVKDNLIVFYYISQTEYYGYCWNEDKLKR